MRGALAVFFVELEFGFRDLRSFGGPGQRRHSANATKRLQRLPSATASLGRVATVNRAAFRARPAIASEA
jgi:hypothetical protein